MSNHSLDRTIRILVTERSGGVCERCQERRANAIHHRRLRSQGGADSLLNLCHLCRKCHDWAHANPAEAAAGMWIVTPKFHGAEVAREYEVD